MLTLSFIWFNTKASILITVAQMSSGTSADILRDAYVIIYVVYVCVINSPNVVMHCQVHEQSFEAHPAYNSAIWLGFHSDSHILILFCRVYLHIWPRECPMKHRLTIVHKLHKNVLVRVPIVTQFSVLIILQCLNY